MLKKLNGVRVLSMDYNTLSDAQRENIDYFLDRADNNRLDILRNRFGVARKRNLSDARAEIISELTFGHIPFSDFNQWLSQVELEGNNTIFVYEAEESDFLDSYSVDSLYDSFKEKITPIYDVNARQLSDIVLTDVTKFNVENQVLFTLAAPSRIQLKSGSTLLAKDHVYLSYISVDFNSKSVVLYMHPTAGLLSVNGQLKRRDIDDVTWILLKFFRDNILSFNLKEPEWIPEALVQISEEYFDHNNSVVTDKKNIFVEDFLPSVLKSFKEFDPLVSREDSLLRLKRGIEKIYENEMVVIHGRVEKDVNFHVFLQQADRGAIQFKADSRGKAISHADGGDFVKLMSEHSDLLNIGIVHNANEREYSYIVKKTEKYYSLKKYRTSGAEKEVVDDVLRKLNQYKIEIESTNSESETEDSGRRIDGAEA